MSFVERFVVDDLTRLAQRRASDPRASAWVSANAGAGKTKVLTDRVVRLLLSGAPPARILCLTFTKAAAANMAIRVFERLGRWVTQDEERLRDELTELQGEAPRPDEMRLARRLFARAVETPGGLKIETIHAFCERLLHLVPFEANVPARFAVLDEAQVEEAIDRAIDNVLADAANGGPTHERFRDALQAISLEAIGETLRMAIKDAVGRRAFLRHREGPQAMLERLANALGLDAGETADGIERAMLEDGLDAAERRSVADRLRAGTSPSDRDRAEALLAAAAADDPAERLDHYLRVFFTNDGTPRARIVTQGAGRDLQDLLTAEQSRLVALEARRKSARAVERTRALFVLAAEIHARVERRKAQLGALDFDDLIERTLELLSRGEADWILYKLDRGIDHVLVDEAQDTNPEQWEILRLLTEDFTAGEGARGAVRTLFAVGDPKQSIYSFQGAAPHKFEDSRRLWQTRSRDAGLAFEDVSLTLSFRSANAVLSAVDATFAVPGHYRGLSFADAAVGTVHTSARPEAPGHVELWPTQTREGDAELDAWTAPVDQPESSSPPIVVAQRVAKAIQCWVTEGDEWGRVRRPGDILVLMRRRGPAFDAVIRALRAARVPVAGHDRLKVSEHIAVLDLVAAGRTALLPDDDLTLATALKSPLVGLTDDDLIRIAATRAEDEALVDALERHAEAGDDAARRGLEALCAWKNLARRHGPFGFYVSLLGPLGGRARLVARLGGEAGDAIDVFLCSAHQAETALDAPSLTAFLSRYEPSGGREPAGHAVKRDLDAGRDEVRVMTVHGSKGLEAAVVVVIDGCEDLGRDPPLVTVTLPCGGEVPVWSPSKGQDCFLAAAARATLHALARDEHNRLLYVAMTRAKDRLVIAPYLTGRRDAPQHAWCEMIRRALTRDAGGLIRTRMPYEPLEADVWRDREPVRHATPADVPAAIAALEVPAWLHGAVEPEPETEPPLRPSSALGAADRRHRSGDGSFARQARRRGIHIHALLERLPRLPFERWAEAARAFVATRAPSLNGDERERIVRDALGVLTHDALQPLFGRGSRAEAPIAGRIATEAGAVAVSGQIDRLAVLAHEVLLADFKTSVRPPRAEEPVPAVHAAQLALYRKLVCEIFPGRRVRAFLIWTSGPAIRELTEAEMGGALAGIKAA